MTRFLTILVLFIVTHSATAKEIRFSVRIDNPVAEYFSLSFTDNLYNDEERSFRFTLKSENESHFLINMDAASMVKLQHGEQVFWFFVDLDDKLQIHFDATNMLETLNFRGYGAQNNNFLARLQRDFPGITIPRYFSRELLPTIWDAEMLGKADSMSESEFFNLIDEQRRTQLSRMNGIGLTTVFSVYLRNRINYHAAGLKLLYLTINQWNYDAATLSTKYKTAGILTGLNKNDSHLIEHPDFVACISAFVYTQALSGPKDLRGDEFTYYDVINKHFTGKVRDFLLTKLFFNAFRFGKQDLLTEYYPNFRKDCPYQEFKVFLDQNLGVSLAFDDDGPAPAFSLPDEYGQEISLSGFRGKVVYLSFWATWCKPCLEGFEKSRYIREELQKKGVVLINISVDRSLATWQETMSRVPMPGINLISQDNEILRIYDISSLPVYHIIDKNGNFTYLPEGARNVLEEFERLVNE
ncbi:MAG: TlpA disulfide reductase family protein [Bacteroidota bacterium]